MCVVPLPVVRAQKSLHMTPRALCSVCVGACTLVKKPMVWLTVRCVTFRVKIPVCSPAVADDRSAGFDASIYNGHHSVGGSIRKGTIEHKSSSLRVARFEGGGKRENIGHELRDQEVVKEALYNIVQRNEVLLLNLCIIFFRRNET